MGEIGDGREWVVLAITAPDAMGREVADIFYFWLRILFNESAYFHTR